jgi:hypothetical protein
LHDAVGLETRGVPTAVIITAAFAREAEVQRAALGADRLDAVVITHPLSTLSDDEIQARAAEAVSQIRSVLRGR